MSDDGIPSPPPKQAPCPRVPLDLSAAQSNGKSSEVPEVSRLVLGCQHLARYRDPFAFLDAAYAYGINAFDCAVAYGTDDILGRWHTERGIPRSKLFFLVKGAHPEGDPGVAPNRVNKAAIEADLAKALRELRTTYADVFMLHRDDPEEADLPEVAACLDKIVRDGKARAYGLCNWTPARIDAAAFAASERRLVQPAAFSAMYSMTLPKTPLYVDTTLIDESARYHYVSFGKPVFAWAALCHGFASGKYDEKECANATSGMNKFVKAKFGTRENWLKMQRARIMASKYRCTVSQIAVAYVCRTPGLDAFAIVGSRSGDVSRIEEAVVGAHVRLSEADWAYLDLADERESAAREEHAEDVVAFEAHRKKALKVAKAVQRAEFWRKVMDVCGLRSSLRAWAFRVGLIGRSVKLADLS